MNAVTLSGSELEVYVCPACKSHLMQEDGALRCPTCSKAYPMRQGIPDFVLEELSRSADPQLRRMRFIDQLARIYETKLWYPVILKVFGGFRSRSLAQLISTVAGKVEAVKGRVLDIACGPGTFGRRIASPSKQVFGIDVSMGMLRQGVAYTVQEDNPHMHFARTRVEVLPFATEVFDATVCCDSLHLFTDKVRALREMARAMKPGAILVVFTFTAGRGGILKYRWGRERSRNHGFQAFDLPEMQQYLTASGFQDFQPDVRGSTLTFSARKQPA